MGICVDCRYCDVPKITISGMDCCDRRCENIFRCIAPKNSRQNFVTGRREKGDCVQFNRYGECRSFTPDYAQTPIIEFDKETMTITIRSEMKEDYDPIYFKITTYSDDETEQPDNDDVSMNPEDDISTLSDEDDIVEDPETDDDVPSIDNEDTSDDVTEDEETYPDVLDGYSVYTGSISVEKLPIEVSAIIVHDDRYGERTMKGIHELIEIIEDTPSDDTTDEPSDVQESPEEPSDTENQEGEGIDDSSDSENS